MVDSSADQKRAMGRWQNDSMEGSYLNYIPIQGMMNWAGFKSKDTYFLHRDTTDPPEELLKSIFLLWKLWRGVMKILPLLKSTSRAEHSYS